MFNTFKNDLDFSNKYEIELISLMKGHIKAETSQQKGKFSDWDVCFTYADGHTETHEVKCDRNGHKTGNVVIEFECNGKPSGISTSKADYYTFFIISPDSGYTCIILETQHVRNQIAKEKYTKIIDMGQRYNTGKLYLFNIDTLVGDCCFDDDDVFSDNSDDALETQKIFQDENDTTTTTTTMAAEATIETATTTLDAEAENNKSKQTVFAP